MSKESKDKIKLYHHTDRKSAEQILKTGKILQSDPAKGDAVHGPGTYMTSKGPEHSKSEIARNNYDGATARFWESKVQAGKTDVAIEASVPKASVTKCPGERDVYKVQGNLKLGKDTKVHIRDQSTRGYSTYANQ